MVFKRLGRSAVVSVGLEIFSFSSLSEMKDLDISFKTSSPRQQEGFHPCWRDLPTVEELVEGVQLRSPDQELVGMHILLRHVIIDSSC